MKKLFFATLLLPIFSLTNARAQDNSSFKKGDFVINAGHNGVYFLKSLYDFAYSDPTISGKTTSKVTGPVGVGFEYAANDWLGVGLQANYSKFTATNDDLQGYKSTEVITSYRALLRVTAHFGGDSEKWDPYIGLGAGYNYSKYVVTDNDNDEFNNQTSRLPFPVAFTGSIGTRFYPVRNVGIYGELGYLTGSLVQGGIVLKF